MRIYIAADMLNLDLVKNIIINKEWDSTANYLETLAHQRTDSSRKLTPPTRII